MRILLIDENFFVLRAFSRTLRAHQITATTSASEALEMIRRGHPFDAIVCDMHVTGRDFYLAIDALSPCLAARIIFTSASLNDPEDAAFAEQHRTLLKPFSVGELRNALQPLTDAESA